jgi:hypothetical protein
VKLFLALLLFSASTFALGPHDFRQAVSNYLQMQDAAGLFEGQDGKFPCQVTITSESVTVWNGKTLQFSFDDENPVVREIDNGAFGSLLLTIRGHVNSFRRWENVLKMNRNSQATTFQVIKKWDAEGPFDDRAECKINNSDLQ